MKSLSSLSRPWQARRMSWTYLIHEERGIRIERQQRDAARIVDVFIEHTRHARACERVGQRARIVASSERQQLHEQPLIGSLRLSVPDAALFAEVRRLRA